MSLILISTCIGALTGVIAALCGVGGGIIMVPAFALLLGLEQKAAVATSLAAMALTVVLASAKNHSNGFVSWQVAIPTGVAAGLVAWFAADLLKALSNQTLTRVFAVTMILFGIRMLFQK